MFTYIETSQMQQRHAELNKPAQQNEGWTHPCPNVVDRVLASVKARFSSKPLQPAGRKPAGAH